MSFHFHLNLECLFFFCFHSYSICRRPQIIKLFSQGTLFTVRNLIEENYFRFCNVVVIFLRTAKRICTTIDRCEFLLESLRKLKKLMETFLYLEFKFHMNLERLFLLCFHACPISRRSQIIGLFLRDTLFTIRGRCYAHLIRWKIHVKSAWQRGERKINDYRRLI